MITASDIKTAFAEFASLDDATVQAEVDFAYSISPECVWGNTVLRDKAVKYLAAHFLKIDSTIGAADGSGTHVGKTITSDKVGDLSRTYAKGTSRNPDDEAYNATPYGIQYLSLRKRIIAPRVAGMPC